MQLFHTDHNIKNNILTISNPDTISQCRKVLRLKAGDLIHVQSTNNDKTIRYLTKIIEISKDLTGEIIETRSQIRSEKYIKIFMAMPNKKDKLELVIQKLTEIGIDEIIFRPAERSIIKKRNKNQEKRLDLITKEALEQSRGWFLPKYSFMENPENTITEDFDFYVFDKKEEPKNNIEKSPKRIGVIGPEGGLTKKDYERFLKHNPKIYDLGSTMLRTETAAIIGGWLLKNK